MTTLSALVDRLEAVEPSLAVTVLAERAAAPAVIGAVRHDSRAVGPGDLFACVRGQVSDGHRHASDAVRRGAAALLVDHPVDAPAAVPQVLVSDTRRAMAHAACAVAGDPSLELPVIGVTGTNGKTTVTHLIAAIADHAGMTCGVIGTLSGERTTPEAPDLQRALRAMVDDGVRCAAVEVSSHALAQHRIDGTRFAVGAFTNLTPDHLDFHGDLETYFAAKASLFEPGRVRSAVVDVGGPWGVRLAAIVDDRGIGCRRVGIDDADGLVSTIAGSVFGWRGHRVRLALPGRFNVRNALVAAEAARELGIAEAVIAEGLAAARPVPGRFEVISPDYDDADLPVVIVDYAHTPDGLDQILASVAEVAPEAEVAVVFGCGGDRDRSKRPLMGAAAAGGADHVVVTSDNPRSEVPEDIIAEILPGLEGHDRVDVVVDRAAAISAAIEAHRRGDVVVVAGKGHETTQTIGARVVDFDDRRVARAAMGRVAAVRSRAGGGHGGSVA